MAEENAVEKDSLQNSFDNTLKKEDAEELGNLRQEIDEINHELCNLLIKRLKAAGKIADIKERNNLPIVDLKREDEIRKRLFTHMKPEEEVYRPFLEEIIVNVMNSTKKWEKIKKTLDI